jgi:hypothetical protein
MKFQKILKMVGVVVAFAALIGACDDSFLDTPVQGALSSDVLSASEQGVDASLISTYKMLNGFTNTVGNTWGSAPSNYIFNSASDDVHKGSEPSDNPDGYYEVSLYNWSPGYLVFTHKFQALYEGIRRSNNTIQLANQFLEKGGTTEFVNKTIGEAKFLRAWYHFEGYKMWKNVPYYDENDTKDFTKPNTEDVLPKIIADLEAAIPGLATDKSAPGRVDKTVAQALLGKVKLFGKDYAGARAAFIEVVGSGKYVLTPCFNDNFVITTQNSKESIFAFQASVNDGDGNGANSNYLERLAAPHGGSHTGCCGFNNPTQDLVNSYKVDANGLPVADWNAAPRVTANTTTAVDPRLDWTVGRTGVPYLDWGNHSDGWIRGAGWAGLYSPKKNMKLTNDPAGPGWTTNQLHAKNVELIRYADVLLMLAECEVELSNLDGARILVNQVRTRAGNCAQGPNGGALQVPIDDPSIDWANYKVGTYPGGHPSFATQEAAREAVRRERRLELATEGHRIFDLRRWGTLKPTIDAYRAYEKTVTNVVGGTTVRVADLDGAEPVADKHYVFPLPNTEVDRSNGNLKQNTGF